MATINAVGSSLVSVGTFGLTTAVSYAIAGQVDWRIAGLFVLAGSAAGWAGWRSQIACRAAARP